jgi:anthranilate synthase component 1
MRIVSKVQKFFGDCITPVALFLSLRDKYPGSCLLESSDYHGVENSSTILGIGPRLTFEVSELEVIVKGARGEIVSKKTLGHSDDVLPSIKEFFNSFQVKRDNTFNTFNGFIGYISFESIPYFENIKFKKERDVARKIPEARYTLYSYLIEIKHFSNELYITKNFIEGETNEEEVENDIKHLFSVCLHNSFTSSGFKAIGEESSNIGDEENLNIINECKKHIQRGDVFQIVPSRRYSQKFTGDDFQVYRALRAINPSPYLYYFDCGSFKLFGSSPEAQLVIRDGVASLYPIAGTCPRTGVDVVDRARAQELYEDPKENAEHVMLVDLARNDLSRFCKGVHVPVFKEIQYYSHVTHLVSRVEGKLKGGASAFDILSSTFPAGTLSGAPKYRALEILDELEVGRRENYAGAVGLIDFSGNLNHAIVIRSFLSKDNVLHSQAGAGIVADSVPEMEVEEIKNKLGALKQAIKVAEGMSTRG